MDRSGIYYRQVQLLLQTLPIIAQENCFALKGGTAINLFVRDLPRLSVDIDLVYLPMLGRAEALAEIKAALSRISDQIVARIHGANVHKGFEDRDDALRLVVSHAGVQIKIELSPVLRGTVYEPEAMAVTEKVEDEFGYVEMPLVSLPDLYAGKVCAALDRQHPRDLFDIKLLLENEGPGDSISDALRKAVIVYLISHNRPIAELLDPARKDIAALYHNEFVNMAELEVGLDELLAIREQLIELINQSFTPEEKCFLISFKHCTPDWSLLGLEGMAELPAVKWKLINLQRMNKEKYRAAVEKLEALLGEG